MHSTRHLTQEITKSFLPSSSAFFFALSRRILINQIRAKMKLPNAIVPKWKKNAHENAIPIVPCRFFLSSEKYQIHAVAQSTKCEKCLKNKEIHK